MKLKHHTLWFSLSNMQQSQRKSPWKMSNLRHLPWFLWLESYWQSPEDMQWPWKWERVCPLAFVDLSLVEDEGSYKFEGVFFHAIFKKNQQNFVHCAARSPPTTYWNICNAYAESWVGGKLCGKKHELWSSQIRGPSNQVYKHRKIDPLGAHFCPVFHRWLNGRFCFEPGGFGHANTAAVG